MWLPIWRLGHAGKDAGASAEFQACSNYAGRYFVLGLDPGRSGRFLSYDNADLDLDLTGIVAEPGESRDPLPPGKLSD